ncbi:type II toxin-antitoxin system RatA family toxin [Sphingosinicella humi]|uniref:Ubiquinone-binding protein n=1 Tax=Allosphingosinicella humi TaxID=2068657 RepID=A0A2U2IYR1_9SPHN|nr:type II toxin-antitoxin system RatA family toxin [Sphingosinicella humi]PWG01233.1 ubiquinone-binding protein [Sphingosinicella humi]
MPRHSEKRNLPYSPEEMFDLVADVGRYQEFLPWVAATRIRSNSDTLMIADLVVGFRSLKETFTSRVEKQRPRHITVDYVEGPLKYLKNDWEFTPDGKGGTDIDFCVDFAFKSRIFETIAGQMFDRALRRMIAAFEERAHALYGDASSATGMSRSRAQSAA